MIKFTFCVRRLPSDDQSCTIDDRNYDQEYLPPKNAIIIVEDNKAIYDTAIADENLLDILNLNNNEI